MIQITPQMRMLVAVAPADFRCGIDGLARVCRQALGSDPFSGTVFVFRNRRGTGVKVLVYDGQGFWLCYKRLSHSRFRWTNPRASRRALFRKLCAAWGWVQSNGYPRDMVASPRPGSSGEPDRSWRPGQQPIRAR